VGEAGAQPAVSLIGDYFEPRGRATMIGLQSIGGLYRLLLGGWINQYLCWRAAFWSLGLQRTGFAIAFWLTMPELRRGATEGAINSSAAPPPRVAVR
jgi:MFS transporter, Spinster family, sphingosine-1-phosphate transporter